MPFQKRLCRLPPAIDELDEAVERADELGPLEPAAGVVDVPRGSPWPLRSRRCCRVGSRGRACSLRVVGAPEERRFHVDGVELAEDGIRRPNQWRDRARQAASTVRSAAARSSAAAGRSSSSGVGDGITRDPERSLVRPTASDVRPTTSTTIIPRERDGRMNDGSDHQSSDRTRTYSESRRSKIDRSQILVPPPTVIRPFTTVFTSSSDRHPTGIEHGRMTSKTPGRQCPPSLLRPCSAPLPTVFHPRTVG